MGAITSRDTRRISFDNNFAMSPILLQKTIEDSGDIDITDGVRTFFFFFANNKLMAL